MSAIPTAPPVQNQGRSSSFGDHDNDSWDDDDWDDDDDNDQYSQSIETNNQYNGEVVRRRTTVNRNATIKKSLNR